MYKIIIYSNDILRTWYYEKCTYMYIVNIISVHNYIYIYKLRIYNIWHNLIYS